MLTAKNAKAQKKKTTKNINSMSSHESRNLRFPIKSRMINKRLGEKLCMMDVQEVLKMVNR